VRRTDAAVLNDAASAVAPAGPRRAVAHGFAAVLPHAMMCRMAQPPPEQAPDFPGRLRFLQSAAARRRDGAGSARIETIETHMSWVFLSAGEVLKLKKAVRYPYLDFSTLAAREAACREELRINARLAPDVYLGLCALHWDGRRLSVRDEADLPASGEVLEWLVRMRRLPGADMLDARIADRRVGAAEIDALADVLVAFYKRATRVPLDAAAYLAHFAREQALNREVLGHPAVALPQGRGVLDRLDRVLQRHGAAIGARATAGCIVDGHGDLRPEHVCLLSPPVVIDALEFNAGLRQVDPLDEIGYLGLECELAGAAWIGPRLAARCQAVLEPAAPPAITVVALAYRAYRAVLRARLSAAHLLDPHPREAGRWRPLAQRYLRAAVEALDAVEGGGGSVARP
jgi:aminoglycoside phosphotransferase family enzyme